MAMEASLMLLLGTHSPLSSSHTCMVAFPAPRLAVDISRGGCAESLGVVVVLAVAPLGGV